MAETYIITSQKGGTGKTTSSAAIVAALSEKGCKVLLIDTDPQCNASDTFRAKIENQTTLYDVLCDGAPMEEAIQKAEYGDIVASDPLLSEAESLLNKTGKEHILRKALLKVKEQYDYIIIDTPPTLGVLLINGLTAADYVIVPVTADRYSLQGLSQLAESIHAVQEYTNPNLKIAGLLLVRHNIRTNLSKDVTNSLPQIAQGLDTKLFETYIRDSVAVKEAQALRKTLFEHAPKSTTAEDYKRFVDELIEERV